MDRGLCSAEISVKQVPWREVAASTVGMPRASRPGAEEQFCAGAAGCLQAWA